ncbi:VWA domain-containing protein [Methanolobus sp. ZRKC5]|uniref:VWA domain-containing protein n=1 Tax=unclassified Methanolobus TaxID=2629569 RepID=UPI00313A7B1E
MVRLENPEMLWLIIPALIAGFYLLKKGTKKGLIISRIVVATLLIVALASPFTLVPRVTTDDNPDLVIISDETASMELFENGTAAKLYEALSARTSASIVRLTGDNTALGDTVMQYSTGDNQIVLVTDGNSNTGEELEDALQFAKETGTTVYYVQPELEENDLTVQIEGDKTIILRNENQFNIVVSQAMEQEITYSYELYIDDNLERSGPIIQTTREKSIPVTKVIFDKPGAHTLKAIIIPSGFDVDTINNQYYKSVYVVPKPTIRAIGLETNSPLADILLNLYDVSTSGELDNIDDKKAIILDNTHANTFTKSEVEELKDYLNEGRGIVVVGGERAYNYGDYLDSPIEEILPVLSKPTDWSGGRNIVLLLDNSHSSVDYETYDYIISNAILILNNKNFKDSYAGVVTFGGKGTDISNGLVYLGTQSNAQKLEEELKNLIAGGGSGATLLHEGLNVADSWLEGEEGKLDIIILSDGAFGQTYDETLQVAKKIHDKGISFYFIKINSGDPGQSYLKDDKSNYYADLLMENVEGKTIYLEKGQLVDDIYFDESDTSSESPDNLDVGVFPLVKYNTKHFITRNIEINGSITGYNDVTPKAGADRLIITSTGKPVLTTWRYGLGRVAALSTDNGQGGDNMWATQLYSDNNSKLMSSTVNWAIGNPREETGAVVDAPDTWYGTPVTIELTMYDEGIPTLKLDGDALDLSLTGNNVYEAVIDPSPIGLHDLSGYPVAVNYALEYRDVGLNEDLPALIKAYGGNTFSPNEARANLFEEAQGKSEKLVRDNVSQKIYFLLAALIIFLGEVILRRIKEIKEMKKLQQQESDA